MLLGTPLNLGNTVIWGLKKVAPKSSIIFGSCQLWDAPKRKDPIISSMRCSHDPFLSLKRFPGSQATPPKSQATPARLLSDSSLPWEPQSITSIRKLSFELLCIQSCCAYDILGGGGALKRRGNFCSPATLATQSGKNSKTKATSSMPSAKKWSVKVIFSSVVDFCFIWVCYWSIFSQHSNLMVHFQVQSQVKFWSLFQFATTKVRSKLSFLYQLDQLIQMNSLVLESSPKIRLRTKGLSFISFIWLTCWSKALLRPS